MTTPPQTDGRSDFDFLFGDWHVRNRRLRERLSGCTDWEEFAGISHVRPILGGLGNIDEISLDRAGGRLHGCTLRLFNPATHEWSIYWSDSQRGVLLPPMIGAFVAGVGEFYAQEVEGKRTVLSRFIWSGITTATPRWEQALSADGGRTWETNWTMDLRRLEAERGPHSTSPRS
jgi:hypothetical protein